MKNKVILILIFGFLGLSLNSQPKNKLVNSWENLFMEDKTNTLKCMYQSYIMGLNDSKKFFKLKKDKLPSNSDIMISFEEIYNNISMGEIEENNEVIHSLTNNNIIKNEPITESENFILIKEINRLNKENTELKNEINRLNKENLPPVKNETILIFLLASICLLIIGLILISYQITKYTK